MQLTLTKTPVKESPSGFKCRYLGVGQNTPNIFEFTVTPQTYASSGFTYLDGALNLTIDATTRGALNVNDLIQIEVDSVLVSSKIEGFSDAGGGEFFMETSYVGGSLNIGLNFNLVSPVNLVVEITAESQGKPNAVSNIRLDKNGIGQFDVNPLVRPWLDLYKNFDYVTAVAKEPTRSTTFRLKYRTIISGTPSNIFNIEGKYTAHLGSNQNLNIYDSNFLEYVPTGDLLPAPINNYAKFLNTYEGKLFVWPNRPNALEFVNENAVQNLEVVINGQTIPLDTNGEKGSFNLNITDALISGASKGQEVCADTTGTGDGETPPPIFEKFKATSYFFRGNAAFAEGEPPPPPPSPLCGANFLINSKKFDNIGSHVVTTFHSLGVLQPNDWEIHAAILGAGTGGTLDVWYYLYYEEAGIKYKVATTGNNTPNDGAGFTGDLAVFDNSRFGTSDGVINLGSVPSPEGNRFTQLNNELTLDGKPTIPVIAGLGQLLWWKNTDGVARNMGVAQIVAEPSDKYARLSGFSKKICY